MAGRAVPAGCRRRPGRLLRSCRRRVPHGAPTPGLPSPLPEVPFPGPYPPPLGQAAPSGAPVQPAATGAYDYPRFLRDAGHAGRAPEASARRGTLPLHVLWVDDKPESVVHLVQELRQLGAEVDTALSTGEAATWLARHPAPDVLISDTKRAGDVVEGFRAVVQFRKAGYDGPVVFYSGQVSGHNHRLAEEVGAIGLTNSWSVLVELLDGIVRSRPARTDP